MRSCGIVRENLKSVSLLVARDIGLVLDVGSRGLDEVHVLSLYLTTLLPVSNLTCGFALFVSSWCCSCYIIMPCCRCVE